MQFPRWLRNITAQTFALDEREDDVDFRQTVSSHASKGLFLLGLLGIVSVLINLGANSIFGKEIVWSPGDSGTTILIWDKLVLLALSIVVLLLSGQRVDLRWKRIAASSAAMTAAASIIIDDFLQGGVFVSEQYVGLLAIVLIISVPFKPWQAVLVVAITMAGYIIASAILQGYDRVVINGFTPGVIVFGTIVFFLAAGLSFLLYNTRYEQHRMKLKSDRLTENLRKSMEEHNKTKDRLIHAQRMASIGNLSAGIAHELSNPLNFVNNFAVLSSQILEELSDEVSKRGADGSRSDDIEELLDGLRENIERIDKHGRRATDIVKNMINHTNYGSSEVDSVVVSRLIESTIGPASSSVHVANKSFAPKIVRNYHDEEATVVGIPTELERVFWNILKNAFYEISEKARLSPRDYQPAITISTVEDGRTVVITITDNGRGIAQEVEQSIMEPFVTTKPPGVGTGLGLSMTYDIVVEGHGGSIDVENHPGEGATFIVALPIGDSASSVHA